MQPLIPLPSAPTDNLYKFLALSGVAMMVAGATFPILNIRDLNNKGIELQTELLVLDADMHSNESRATSANQWSKDLLRDVRNALEEARDAGVAVANDYRTKIEKDADALLKQNDAVIARSDEMTRRLAALDGKNLALGALRSETHALVWGGYALFCIGAVLTIFGFSRWYTLYQKPQDDLVREQIAASAAKARADAPPAASAAPPVDPPTAPSAPT